MKIIYVDALHFTNNLLKIIVIFSHYVLQHIIIHFPNEMIFSNNFFEKIVYIIERCSPMFTFSLHEN